MKYSDFIEEIKKSLDDANSLFNKEEIHFDSEFRKWREKITTAIETIEEQSYNINCNVRDRIFDIASYEDISKKDKIKKYNLDLQDTVNEIETIIDYFSKYGDPKFKETKIIESKSKKELDYPPKVTLNWLKKHTPISLWLKMGGIILTAFLLGVGFSETKLYENIQKIWQKEQASLTKSSSGTP